MNILEQNSQIYLDTAAAFVDLVARIPLEVYEQPALGEWNVRHLIGHTSRSMQTVLDYLPRRVDTVAHHTASSYYHSLRAAAAAPGVAARGVAAGEPLRKGALAPMQALLAQVTDALDALPDDGDERAEAGQVEAGQAQAGQVEAGQADPIIETIAGGMRLGVYLRTRILELVVHSLDLSRATGVPVDLPADALRVTLAVELDTAVLDGRGPELVLALAGRHSLDPAFSIF